MPTLPLPRLWLAGWLLLGGMPTVLNGADDEIPRVGRPADLPFSGASAGFHFDPEHSEYQVPFLVSTTASAKAIQEQEAVLLTLTVQARGQVRTPPQRLDLQEIPALAQRFYLEDVTEGRAATTVSRSWQWVYRLRPRSVGLQQIPGIPFVYYNPDLQPVTRSFQVIWTDPLPLEVRPSERDAPPVTASESILKLDPDVLRTPPRTGIPWGWWWPLWLGTPLACAGWYLVWHWLYADAATLARRRRSRAERQALRALAQAKRLQGRAQADRIVAIVAEYLQARLGWSGAEPTPTEITAFLRQNRYDESLVEQTRHLLELTSAVRFGPIEEAHLLEAARVWIQAIEEASCPPGS